MNVKPMLVWDRPIFPHSPYQSPFSKSFLMAVKSLNYNKLDKLLALDRFLVFHFDECRQTGLIWAAKRNHTDMVKYLLQNHSRVNFRDIAGRTALIFATKNNNIEMSRLLLNYNADPTIQTDAGVSAYTLAKTKQNSVLT